MKEQITYDIFDKVDIRVGTVISVKKNEKARKPSLVVEVDFGEEIGIKQSSAQITHYYNEENLLGKQVIGVCNFPQKNIARGSQTTRMFSFPQHQIRQNGKEKHALLTLSTRSAKTYDKRNVLGMGSFFGQHRRNPIIPILLSIGLN